MTIEQIKAKIYDLSIESDKLAESLNRSVEAKRLQEINKEIMVLRKELDNPSDTPSSE